MRITKSWLMLFRSASLMIVLTALAAFAMPAVAIDDQAT